MDVARPNVGYGPLTDTDRAQSHLRSDPRERTPAAARAGAGQVIQAIREDEPGFSLPRPPWKLIALGTRRLPSLTKRSHFKH